MKKVFKCFYLYSIVAIALLSASCHWSPSNSSASYYSADVSDTGTSATYCYFGEWPQTIKAEDVTLDSYVTLIKGGHTYYLGSDGSWYAKCVENPWGTDTYSNGTGAVKDNISYFKVEPIKWRVVTEDYNGSGKKLLLAEDILTAHIPYYGSTDVRTLNGKKIYPNNYKYSNIRAYINGINNQFVTDGGTATDYDINWEGKGFLQTAFTAEERKLIAPTKVDNSAASTISTEKDPCENTWACEDTIDKIFLLSENEATNASWGMYESLAGSLDTARRKIPTDYAKANHACYLYIAGVFDTGIWWLRSPEKDDDTGQNSAYYSSFNGAYGAQQVIVSHTGVVPALVLE